MCKKKIKRHSLFHVALPLSAHSDQNRKVPYLHTYLPTYMKVCMARVKENARGLFATLEENSDWRLRFPQHE